jgi:uncharacterized protein
MLGGIGVVTVLVAGLLPAFSGGAEEQARGPAFDCTKASGTVEKLICADEGLAALDRKLDSVYKAATATAKDGLPDTLRAEQRGWVKGRDECWKAEGEGNPVFLTESWKATSVSECVRGEYRLRISELQVQWRLAPEKKPVFYGCENNPANEVVATFFDTDPPAARLERGDRAVIAWQVRSASGAKYEGQNVTFWSKGNEARVTWLGTELKCQAK